MSLLKILIAKLNNAHLQKAGSFFIKKNNFCIKVLRFLYFNGLILGYVENSEGVIVFLNIKDGVNSFSRIRYLKKRGLKLSFRYRDRLKLNNLRRDLVLISTSKGLMTMEEAFKLKIGGEFIFLVIF